MLGVPKTLDYGDIRTTTIYSNALNKGSHGVRSLVDGCKAVHTARTNPNWPSEKMLLTVTEDVKESWEKSRECLKRKEAA